MRRIVGLLFVVVALALMLPQTVTVHKLMVAVPSPAWKVLLLFQYLASTALVATGVGLIVDRRPTDRG